MIALALLAAVISSRPPAADAQWFAASPRVRELRVEQVESRPETPLRIQGLVSAAGKPMPLIRVELRRAGEEFLRGVTWSHEDGTWAFDEVPGGAWDIEIPGKGVAVTGLIVGPKAPPLVLMDLDEAVDDPSALPGLVVARDGRSVAGVRVSGETATADARFAFEPPAVHTDASGRFVVRGGMGVPQFFANDLATGTRGTSPNVIVIDEPTRIELRPATGPRCRGVVLDGEGRRLAGATVSAFFGSAAGIPVDSTVTNLDGEFEIACYLPAARGRNVLRAAKDGWVGLARALADEPVQLRSTRTTRMTLDLQAHLPIGRGTVRWLPEDERGDSRGAGANNFERARAWRFAGATVELSTVPPGKRLEIWVDADGARSFHGWLQVPFTGEGRAAVDLDRAAALRYEPVDSKGYSHRVAACLDVGPPRYDRCKPPGFDPARRFEWSDVPPGPHKLLFYRYHPILFETDDPVATRTITLVGGEVLDLGPVLVAGRPATLAGVEVKDEGPHVVIDRAGDDESVGISSFREGLRVGDLLLSVDGEPVRDAAHARALFEGDDGSVAVLRVRSGDAERELQLLRTPPP